MKNPSLAWSPVRCSKKAAGSFLTGVLVYPLFILGVFCAGARAKDPLSVLDNENPVKQLTLQELSEVEVTTASKVPEQIWKTPAAVFVITQEDIERSGATSIPDALRLAPGVEVAQISSDKWSIGIRGFGSRLSRVSFSATASVSSRLPSFTMINS
jgi:iron complex outermembrane receptor protein